MKSIFSYQDLNFSQLEESTQKILLKSVYPDHFEDPDIIIPCIYGDLKKLEYLLSEKNVNINEKNEDGNTVLYCACYYFGFYNNNHKIIELLLDNKADLNIQANLNRKGNFFGVTPFYVIFDTVLKFDFVNQKNKMNFKFALKILLNYGANINEVNRNGCTILMLAVSDYKISLVEILLCEKINIYIKDNKGETVFDKINKIKKTDDEKRKIYDMVLKYKYNDSIFYSFEEYDMNMFFIIKKN